jgi:hypothetical protein
MYIHIYTSIYIYIYIYIRTYIFIRTYIYMSVYIYIYTYIYVYIFIYLTIYLYIHRLIPPKKPSQLMIEEKGNIHVDRKGSTMIGDKDLTVDRKSQNNLGTFICI